MNFTIFVGTYFAIFKIIPSAPKKFQYNVFINMFLYGISLVLIAKMIKTTVHGCHLEARKITSFSNKNTGRFSKALQQKYFSVVTARKKLFWDVKFESPASRLTSNLYTNHSVSLLAGKSGTVEVILSPARDVSVW